MTHIRSIRLRNWACFRGEHYLALDAIPYAVTAMYEDDVERSNWGGKSTLLGAIPFALFGLHGYRFEEGWISRGEKSGEVELELSDGVRVKRYRGAAGGTQFEVVRTGSTSVFRGDEAQRAIEDILGLGADDFVSTSYFAQRATSGMIGVEGADRTATVSRWLRLEPLEACATSAKTVASQVEKALSHVRGRTEAAKDRIVRALTEEDESTVDDLRAKLPALEASVKEWDELLTLVRTQESRTRFEEERARVALEGKELVRVHKEEDGAAIESAHAGAMAKEATEKQELVELRLSLKHRLSVVTGTFGGACPVSGDECPVKDSINEKGEASARNAEIAQRDVDEQLARVQKVSKDLRDATERLLARKARAEKIKTLLERYKAMEQPAGATLDVGRLEDVQAERDRAMARVADLRRRIREHEAASVELAQFAKEETEYLERLSVCREGVAIFKGAQRRLAEGVLEAISMRANGMLLGSGIDLTLDVEWERDGKGLAEDCATCGAAFPASAKVKTCATCGATRGPKRVQRLEIELSDRSGAAEDLAGLALSLAAGTWLRGDRGSAWSSIFLDEPWSQLDKAHRRIASSHVPSLLRSAHVEQALVISHDPASVASLPGKIVIARSGGWSRVGVE